MRNVIITSVGTARAGEGSSASHPAFYRQSSGVTSPRDHAWHGLYSMMDEAEGRHCVSASAARITGSHSAQSFYERCWRPVAAPRRDGSLYPATRNFEDVFGTAYCLRNHQSFEGGKM